jgi:hypothetical protein
MSRTARAREGSTPEPLTITVGPAACTESEKVTKSVTKREDNLLIGKRNVTAGSELPRRRECHDNLLRTPRFGAQKNPPSLFDGRALPAVT